MARRTNDAEIIQMNSEGKRTTEIAAYYGVSTSAIRQRLRKLGVDNSGRRRDPKYMVNEEFFDTWSADMCYVLGFIITDGNVSGNTISIAQKNIEPLLYIKESMTTDAPIIQSKGLYRLNIHRKHLVESLNAFGVGEKKSLTVGLPYIAEEYFRDFVRGVIDGDGYVHPKGYVITITSGSQLFAEQLTNKLNAKGFTFKCSHDGCAYRVKLSGKAHVEKFGDWLYTGATTYSIDYKRSRMLK